MASMLLAMAVSTSYITSCSCGLYLEESHRQKIIPEFYFKTSQFSAITGTSQVLLAEVDWEYSEMGDHEFFPSMYLPCTTLPT